MTTGSDGTGPTCIGPTCIGRACIGPTCIRRAYTGCRSHRPHVVTSGR